MSGHDELIQLMSEPSQSDETLFSVAAWCLQPIIYTRKYIRGYYRQLLNQNQIGDLNFHLYHIQPAQKRPRGLKY